MTEQCCWGAGARSLWLLLPPPGAPSHLPQVEEQEVPQPSQVLCCLNSKPTGQDNTCKWSLKTVSFFLHETKTIKRGSDYFENNPCSCKKGEQSSQLWLNSAGAEEFIPPCSIVICETTRLILISWRGYVRVHQES